MKHFTWLLIGLMTLFLTMLPLAGCVAKSEYQALPADDNDLKANYEADNNELAEIELGGVITSLSKYKFRKYRLAPVLPLGTPGSWDDTLLDKLSLVKKGTTYYLYYAAWDADEESRIGLATSTDLINWTKEPTNPILTPGATGSWDNHVLCSPSVIYLPRTGEWKMWYVGYKPDKTHAQVGLATSIDGIHWTKYADNPVVRNGALGEFDDRGVVEPKVIYYKGKYYMVYGAQHGGTLDKQKVGLATSPDGITWTKQGEILPYGTKPNSWTAGVIEALRLYHFGDYVLGYFAGASDISWDNPPHGVGFLLTSDFINWVDFPFNPLGFAFATADEEIIFNHDEDIIYGLSWGGTSGTYLYVLPKRKGSQIPIEMLTLSSLAASETSTLANCLEISLDQVERLAITVECTYSEAARAGIRVHIRTSVDNINWDTEDWDSWTLTGFAPGATIRQTKHYDPDVRFLKVLIENLDRAHPVTDIKVTAVLGAD